MLGKIAHALFGKKSKPAIEFSDSGSYWESRYAAGGNSGVGSYDKFAEFKAEVINEYVTTHKIDSVFDFGCGDGYQLELAHYKNYVGFDVSPTVIEQCTTRFANDPTKSFKLTNDYSGEKADLCLSMDVIYHLVEDSVFDAYMRQLFAASTQHVIIYASNHDDPTQPDGVHVRHRKFTNWVAAQQPQWQMVRHIPNRYPYQGNYKTGSFADFHIFTKNPH